jgi:PAS domain S-box-containing protein
MKLFQKLFEASPDAVLLVGADGLIVKANSQVTPLFGHFAEELIGQRIEVLIPERSRSAHIHARAHYVNAPELRAMGQGLELFALRRDGRELPVEISLSPVDTDDGPMVVTVIRDISARQQAEAALRLTQFALDHAADGAAWLRRDGSYAYANEAMGRLFGYSREELLTLTVFDVNREMTPEYWQAFWAKLAEGHPVTTEQRLSRKDGSVLTAEVSANYVAYGGLEFSCASLRDISDRKRANDKERRLRVVLEASLNEIYIFDADTLRFEYVNDCARRNLGYSMDALRELTPVDLKPELTEAAFNDLIGPLRRSEREKLVFRTVHRRADDSRYPVEVHLQLVGRDGKPVFLAVIDDITERLRADEDLKEAQGHLRQAVAAGQVGLWDRDLRTNATYFSPEWKRQIGCDDNEIANDFNEWRSRVHPDDIDGALRTLREYLEGTSGTYEGEFRFRHKDGSYRHILARGSKVVGADGRPIRIVGSHVDITEIRQLQGQFLQAQKMDVIGQLAGGIAHDFNNLLTVIVGSVDLALEGLAADDVVRADLEEVRRAGKQAISLTGQLLSFSRKQILMPTIVNLHAVVTDMRGMLQRLLSENIALVIGPAGSGCHVRVDRGQIEQVIMNLAVNARDAMPRGGVLSIDVGLADSFAGYTGERSSLPPGPCVALRVSDTGVGMDEATVGRVFEPFFTTKDVGRGTGLGLSTVFGIVKQSGGTVCVRSERGRGSTFEIVLPLVEEPLAAAVHRSQPAAPSGRGTETILLVEDEDLLRRLATRVLRSAGYTVLTAANGGIALLMAPDQHVDLLVTDVVMPGIGGLSLARQLVAARPQLRVLFTSGYMDDAALRLSVEEQTSQFLAKPYSTVDLARKVREVLDSREATREA